MALSPMLEVFHNVKARLAAMYAVLNYCSAFCCWHVLAQAHRQLLPCHQIQLGDLTQPLTLNHFFLTISLVVCLLGAAAAR